MADKRIPNARIRQVWLDGRLTTAEAAQLVGLTRVNLWHRAMALGLPPRKAGRSFLITDTARFTFLWENTVAAADMARHFGVSVPTISQTARRLGLSKRKHGAKPVPLRDFLLAQAMAADAARSRGRMIVAAA